MDQSPLDSSVHGILIGCHFLLQGIFPTQGHIQARSPALAGRLLTTSATWENPKPSQVNINHIWVKPPLLYKNSTTVAESHRTGTGVEWDGVRINQLLFAYPPSIHPLIRTG